MATGAGRIICKCYWVKAITCAGHGCRLRRGDLFNFRLVNLKLESDLQQTHMTTFIPNQKQWDYICNWTPKRRGKKDPMLEREIRHRLSFSEPWKDILITEYRWIWCDRFEQKEPSFIRMHTIVKDWLENETPASEQAMWSLVWSGYEKGGPELFQQELHACTYYGNCSNTYTDEVRERLGNSIFADEWREAYDRREIPNDALFR